MVGCETIEDSGRFLQEDIMLKEQELADQDAEAIEQDRKVRADADAALMAPNNCTSEEPAGDAADPTQLISWNCA